MNNRNVFPNAAVSHRNKRVDMRFNILRFQLLAGLTLLSGCSTLTGLDAASTFSCPAEPGVACSSLSATYAASEAGALPYQQDNVDQTKATASQETMHSHRLRSTDGYVAISFEEEAEAASGKAVEKSERKAARSPSPLTESDRPQSSALESAAFQPQRIREASLEEALPRRMPELLLRIWVAPWTDADGDLHDAALLYARIREAQWATAARRNADAGPALMAMPFGRHAAEAAQSGNADRPNSSRVFSSGPADASRTKDPFQSPVYGDGSKAISADKHNALKELP